MFSQTKGKYQYLVICLTIILLADSIVSTRIYTIAPTDLGLASRLPLTFWIGLTFLGALWYVCLTSKRGLIVPLILTVTYLYITPAIVRVPVWLSNSYYPFGESVLIESTGHLVDHPAATLNSYHSWPLFLYFSSAFLLITGMPHFAILKCFPLLMISLYGLLVYLILRIRLETSYAIFGVAWFLGSFWVRQYYFGPPGVAYLFFLLNLLILLRLFFDEKSKKTTLAVLFLLFFTVITLTHALSSFMVIIVLFALYITHRVAHKRPPVVTDKLCIFSTTIFLSYNMFFAPGFFNMSIQTLYEILSFVRVLGIYMEPSRVVGSAAQSLSYMSTLGIIILNVSVLLISVFLMLKNIRSRKHSIEGYSFFSVILLTLLGLFAFTFEYGPHEAYQRAFMFGLVPLSYICVSLFVKKPRLLPVVLLGLLFLNIPAQYGTDSFRLATDTQLSGGNFFADYTPQRVKCFYDFSLYIRYHNPLKQIKFLVIGSLPFTSVPSSSNISKVINKADYVILSELQSNYYYNYLRQNPLEQVDLHRLNKIYDNWGFQILKHANTTYSQ